MNPYRKDNSQCLSKERAMPSLLEHCRAAAKLHGEAVILNSQFSIFKNPYNPC